MKKIKWETATPESQGVDPDKLLVLQRILAERHTYALAIVRHNKIVHEWYAPGSDQYTRHSTAGMAGSIVGGLSLLIALHDGRLGLDDPAWKYIPAWKDDPLKSQISIRHLATHSSGLEPPEQPGKSHEQLEGWKKAFWERVQDPFSIALHQAPVLFRPGTQHDYSATGLAALAYAVTASLRNAPQSDLRTLLKERVMEPIGVPDSAWEISYGRAFEVDGMKLYLTNGGGSYTPRAVARIGQFMLNKGRWQGRQLIDPLWVETAVSRAGMQLSTPQLGAGFGWRTNLDGEWASLPRDAALAAVGAHHQVLLVVPSLELVAVRYGEELSDSKAEGFMEALEKYLFAPLMGTLLPF